MPYITIESGQMTAKQKEILIAKMTQVASEILDIPPKFFFVTLKELPNENIGIGGKTLNKVKSEYSSQQ